jgi:hypothetical protein
MMATITLAQAQEQLDAYLAASLKVATGQEYEIAGRRLKRADAGEIRRQITFWERQVSRLSGGGNGGIRIRGGTPT